MNCKKCTNELIENYDHGETCVECLRECVFKSIQNHSDWIFSKELCRAMCDMFSMDYYDPDTSYQEDVTACYNAASEMADQLRKITN